MDKAIADVLHAIDDTAEFITGDTVLFKEEDYFVWNRKFDYGRKGDYIGFTYSITKEVNSSPIATKGYYRVPEKDMLQTRACLTERMSQ